MIRITIMGWRTFCQRVSHLISPHEPPFPRLRFGLRLHAAGGNLCHLSPTWREMMRARGLERVGCIASKQARSRGLHDLHVGSSPMWVRGECRSRSLAHPPNVDAMWLMEGLQGLHGQEVQGGWRRLEEPQGASPGGWMDQGFRAVSHLHPSADWQ